MKATELEQAVIAGMLADPELTPLKRTVNFDLAPVQDREFTGAGFLSEFVRCKELQLFDAGVSLRWGKVGARLNAAGLETGYLVYVDDGYLATVEGYTYGDEWPEHVESFELYALTPGMELATPPR